MSTGDEWWVVYHAWLYGRVDKEPGRYVRNCQLFKNHLFLQTGAAGQNRVAERMASSWGAKRGEAESTGDNENKMENSRIKQILCKL